MGKKMLTHNWEAKYCPQCWSLC